MMEPEERFGQSDFTPAPLYCNIYTSERKKERKKKM